MDALGTEPTPERADRSRLAAAVCAVAGHRPDRPPIWNSGHGFAKCTRCGRAIVRTIVHGWRLPPAGYRIRWPDEPKVQEAVPTPLSSARVSSTSANDFMGDPLSQAVSSAFDFEDDFGPADRNEPALRRSTP